MDTQPTLWIEWEGSLSDDEIYAISSALHSSSIEGSATLLTERSLGGLEFVVATIVIAMSTRVGEKVVDAIWSGIKSMCKSDSKGVKEVVTLTAKWAEGEVKIVLTLADEKELTKRLEALAKLISPE